MNTTTLSSKDLAAARDAEARRRTNTEPMTASQASTLETMTTMVDAADHGTVANDTHREPHTDRCDFGGFIVAVDGTTTDTRCTSFLSVYNPTTTCAMSHKAQKALMPHYDKV
jgi:hypothetical protein